MKFFDLAEAKPTVGASHYYPSHLLASETFEFKVERKDMMRLRPEFPDELWERIAQTFNVMADGVHDHTSIPFYCLRYETRIERAAPPVPTPRHGKRAAPEKTVRSFRVTLEVYAPVNMSRMSAEGAKAAFETEQGAPHFVRYKRMEIPMGPLTATEVQEHQDDVEGASVTITSSAYEGILDDAIRYGTRSPALSCPRCGGTGNDPEHEGPCGECTPGESVHVFQGFGRDSRVYDEAGREVAPAAPITGLTRAQRKACRSCGQPAYTGTHLRTCTLHPPLSSR